MSIFSKIKDAIFGGEAHAAPASPSATEPSPAPSSMPEPAATTAPPVGGTDRAASSAAGTPTTTSPIDVASRLDAAVKRSGQKLDWKHSIVDLMKALGMDASLAERKELAEELGYTGDKDGSAAMNTWLHRALLKKLSENGGKVPAELLD